MHDFHVSKVSGANSVLDIFCRLLQYITPSHHTCNVFDATRPYYRNTTCFFRIRHISISIQLYPPKTGVVKNRSFKCTIFGDAIVGITFLNGIFSGVLVVEIVIRCSTMRNLLFHVTLQSYKKTSKPTIRWFRYRQLPTPL